MFILLPAITLRCETGQTTDSFCQRQISKSKTFREYRPRFRVTTWLIKSPTTHLREEGSLDQERRQSHHNTLVEILDGKEEDDVPDDDDDEGRDVRWRDVEGG